MNNNISEEIKQRFLCLEFRGKPFLHKGRTVFRAKHRTLNQNYLYSFEEDFAWLMTNEDSIPDWMISQ